MDIAKRSGQDFDVDSVRYAVRSKEYRSGAVCLYLETMQIDWTN